MDGSDLYRRLKPLRIKAGLAARAKTLLHRPSMIASNMADEAKRISHEPSHRLEPLRRFT